LLLAMGREIADDITLASQRVLPRRLTDSGFSFSHPEIGDALAAALAPGAHPGSDPGDDAAR
jgi:NAD dependent epimerase/dehydratase family enzyme